MARGPVSDGDRRQDQTRTQRFCRTRDRFGVADGFAVGKYYIDPQAR
jgi:hypothetical protein